MVLKDTLLGSRNIEKQSSQNNKGGVVKRDAWCLGGGWKGFWAIPVYWPR